MTEQDSNTSIAHEFLAQGSPLVPWLMEHADGDVEAFSHPLLGMVTMARIGATNISWDGDNKLLLHWHDTAEEAEECHNGRVEMARQMTAHVEALIASGQDVTVLDL